MPECPSLAKCPFFNDQMRELSAIKELLKRKYCLHDNSLCARFLVSMSLGREFVPADLIPNQEDRARQLISRGRR